MSVFGMMNAVSFDEAEILMVLRVVGCAYAYWYTRRKSVKTFNGISI